MSTKKGLKKQNDWVKHLTAYSKAHPNMSFKDCMKKAKATYKSKNKPAKKKPFWKK